MSNKIHPHKKTTFKSKRERKTQISFLKKCYIFQVCSITMLNIIKIRYFVQKKKNFFYLSFAAKNIYLQTISREGLVPASIAIVIL